MGYAVGDLRMSLGHGDVWIGVPVRCYMECNIQDASGSQSAIVIGVKEVYKNVRSSCVSLIFCEGDTADKATMIDYSKDRS